MRLPLQEHHKRNWRVASLAPDFTVLDVWRFPLELDGSVTLDQFIAFSESAQRKLIEGNSVTGALFRLRGALGTIFRWDDAPEKQEPARPIPGCSETSLRQRIEASDATPMGAEPHATASGTNFERVYHDETESLSEISNGTVHALMHLARVETTPGKWSPQMAVLVKPRGRMGHHYMSLISPFRHHIVYPAMMRAAKKGWPAYAERHALVSNGVGA